MGEEVRTASDLVRWLKLLALPGWAEVGVALIMLSAVSHAAMPHALAGVITGHA